MALNFLSVREGTKYGPEYTFALKQQVPVICLGDDRPLRSGLKGWFAKIELFAPWNADLRPALFFDLDTYVVGDLSPFEDLDHSKLWMINDFNIPERGESGLLLVPDSPITDTIWQNRQQMWNTDGEYLRQFEHQRLNVVDGIYSYKLHCKEGIPEGARIICFHGRPRPHETQGWAQDYWTTITSPMTKSSTP